MDEKTRLISQLKEAHTSLRSTVKGLGGDLVIYDDHGWRVQDLLAHLAVWYDIRIKALTAWQAGQEYRIPDYQGSALFNQQEYEKHKDRAYTDVYHEWEHVHTELIALMEQIPAERYAETIAYPWGDSGALPLLIDRLIEHENKHHHEILEVLQD